MQNLPLKRVDGFQAAAYMPFPGLLSNWQGWVWVHFCWQLVAADFPTADSLPEIGLHWTPDIRWTRCRTSVSPFSGGKNMKKYTLPLLSKNMGSIDIDPQTRCCRTRPPGRDRGTKRTFPGPELFFSHSSSEWVNPGGLLATSALSDPCVPFGSFESIVRLYWEETHLIKSWGRSWWRSEGTGGWLQVQLVFRTCNQRRSWVQGCFETSALCSPRGRCGRGRGIAAACHAKTINLTIVCGNQGLSNIVLLCYITVYL